MGKDTFQESLPITKNRNERHAILLEMAVVFARAKWTAAQALQFFGATSELLRRNKDERPSGGLDSFFELLYSDPALPTDFIERLLLEIFRDNTYREVMVRRINEVCELLEETGNLELPYREWLRLYFAGEAKRKEESKSKTGNWKSRGTAWPKPSQRDEDDEDFVG